MIVDPSDIVGRNRRQENSNAMVSECEVNMGMVGIDSIHVEPEWFFWCGFSTAVKWKKSRSSRQTRTHDGSGTCTVLPVHVHLKNVCVCTHALYGKLIHLFV